MYVTSAQNPCANDRGNKVQAQGLCHHDRAHATKHKAFAQSQAWDSIVSEPCYADLKPVVHLLEMHKEPGTAKSQGTKSQRQKSKEACCMKRVVLYRSE